MNAFDYSRVIIALMCIGAAEQSLDETIAYVKQRQAFGRPLAKFEGVSFPIAEHATMLEAARWLCYRALWLRDQGLPHAKEAAMVKWWGPKVAVDAIHDCLLPVTMAIPRTYRWNSGCAMSLAWRSAMARRKYRKSLSRASCLDGIPALSVTADMRDILTGAGLGCASVEGAHERLPSDR